MQKSIIPPNLHFNSPHPEIKPLLEKPVKLVTETTAWNGEYAAFNCFGFGGVNVHGLLKSPQDVPKTTEKKTDSIPQLVLYCGRTEESVQSVFDNNVLKEANRDFFALLHKLAYAPTQLKSYRGYKLLVVKDDILDVKVSGILHYLFYNILNSGHLNLNNAYKFVRKVMVQV